MARLLFRLGRLCAKRAWVVIGIWLVILAAAGVSYGFGHGQLESSFDIPNLPSSQVVSELQAQLPDYAGVSGSVVYTTTDGSALTQDQKSAISALTAGMTALPDVASVVDPIAAEQQRASSLAQIADGKSQISDNLTQLHDQQAQLTAQLAQLTAAGQQPVTAEEQAQLTSQQEQLTQAEQQVEAGLAQAQIQQNALDQGAQLADLASTITVVSSDGSTAVVSISFTKSRLDLPNASREAVVDYVAAHPVEGTTVGISGEISQNQVQILGLEEIVGLLVALIVLGVLLRALVAAALPLVSALTGVGVGVLASLSLSKAVVMTVYSPVLGVMLGLAVGIDYSLFILNRHRRQLLAGTDLRHSIALATGTSGSAVVFAGATVCIALLALNVVGIPFLSVMGDVGAVCVAIAAVIAVTLLPALLGLIGPRVLTRRERARLAEQQSAAAQAAAQAGSAEVVRKTWRSVYSDRIRTEKEKQTRPAEVRPMSWRRAILTVCITIPALLVVALPALQMRLGLPDDSSEPTSSQAHIAYDTISREFGQGATSPLIVTAHLPTAADQATLSGTELEIAQNLAAVDGVVGVAPVGVSADQTLIAFEVLPDGGPNSTVTADVVTALRDLPPVDGQIRLGVAGQAAINIDISNKLLDVLLPYLLVVVGLSLIIMILVFRSLLVPLIATLGYVLSLFAAYGADVAIFQWGWLAGVFGIASSGPILNFLPIMLAGILFGLAMDYQLFLTTGMREAFATGAPARLAVMRGWHAARTVVIAAGLIMVCVFGGFVFSPSTIIRPLALTFAIAIAFDAFVVRLTLVPAVMHMIGQGAWWIPRWLDKILPTIDVEGTKLASGNAGADERM